MVKPRIGAEGWIWIRRLGREDPLGGLLALHVGLLFGRFLALHFGLQMGLGGWYARALSEG